jgi:hypothetical protein
MHERLLFSGFIGYFGNNDLLDCKSENGCGRQGDGEFPAVLRGGEDGRAARFERFRRDGDLIIIW